MLYTMKDSMKPLATPFLLVLRVLSVTVLFECKLMNIGCQCFMYVCM